MDWLKAHAKVLLPVDRESRWCVRIDQKEDTYLCTRRLHPGVTYNPRQTQKIFSRFYEMLKMVYFCMLLLMNNFDCQEILMQKNEIHIGTLIKLYFEKKDR